MITEQFCLVLTPTFSWVAVLGHRPHHQAHVQFSFVPTTVTQALATLRSRVELTQTSQLSAFDELLQQFPTVAPNYRIPMTFSRHLLQALARLDRAAVMGPRSQAAPRMVSPRTFVPVSAAAERLPAPPEPPAAHTGVAPSPMRSPEPSPSTFGADHEASESSCNDIELLKAIAHEVRTPLSTIQTLTRLLLKRSDLPPEAVKRVQAIQRECRAQIDRFGLIFRAMELTTAEPTSTPLPLTSVALQQVLQENIPRWQQQATRRDLSLNVTVPQHLPAIVISDPAMLDQVLTGLIDRLSQSLPTRSQIDLKVDLAGDQLKLQLRSHCDGATPSTSGAEATDTPMFKAVGQLLMLQPETGGLSLSMPVTKHLFRALGGKLTVRTHHHQGEVLTIFLPLGTEGNAY